MYKIEKIEEPRIFRDTQGTASSLTVDLHVRAPKKSAEYWTVYVGQLRLWKGGGLSFSIIWIPSMAWGNSAYRTPPVDYDRTDIKEFVMQACKTEIQQWQDKLL